MHTRDEILKIDYAPFSEEILLNCIGVPFARADDMEQYVYTMITYQYYQVFKAQYGYDLPPLNLSKWPYKRVLLYRDYIGDILYSEVLQENYSIMYHVLNICNWSYFELELNPEVITEYESPEQYLGKSDLSKEKLERLELFEDVLEEAFELASEDCATLTIMYSRKIGRYLKFREENMSSIRSDFLKEDERIMELLEFYIGHPLTAQFSRASLRHEDEYLVAFNVGFNGYYSFDLIGLYPTWVLSNYIVDELIDHAENIFGYEENGGAVNGTDTVGTAGMAGLP